VPQAPPHSLVTRELRESLIGVGVGTGPHLAKVTLTTHTQVSASQFSLGLGCPELGSCQEEGGQRCIPITHSEGWECQATLEAGAVTGQPLTVT
jgi:hypothetical protein